MRKKSREGGARRADLEDVHGRRVRADHEEAALGAEAQRGDQPLRGAAPEYRLERPGE